MLNQDAYLSAFARLRETLPAEQYAARDALLQRFLSTGLPGTDEELFKYTDFRALDKEAVLPSAAVPGLDTARWQLEGVDTRTWINGYGSDSAIEVDSDLGNAVHLGLAALNRAFARSGLHLDLPKNHVAERPLQVLLLSQAQADGEMTHLRHRIRLGAHAKATVILRDIGLGDAQRWNTQTLEIDLAAGAQLQLIRIQAESTGTRSWFQGTARLQDSANLEVTQIDLGGALVRNDWRIHLQAAGAETVMRGLFAPTGRAHIDTHLLIDHAAPHCRSQQTVRGLAWDRARGVFNGKVVVQPGAQKTDSEQRIANLLLSDKAEINAKPELEIYADDVKCAHGATFGQLDEAALFYLRSRGVSESAARSLLVYSFANEILQHIEPAALRAPVTERLLSRIGGEFDVDVLE